MAHNMSCLRLIAVACIFVADFHSSKGLICLVSTNPPKYVQYDENQICCNGTLHNTSDIEGRKRSCCDSSLESCVVTVSDPSHPDTTKSSPGSSKMPEINGDKRCRNTDHMYCKYAETCIDPSVELCCPDGVFRGITDCPSHDFNSKFCSDNDRFESKVCPDKYKHAYCVTIGEIITEEGSSKMFWASARNTMTDGSCKRRRRLSKTILRLKINMTNCDLTGRTLTVFSTKKHRWNSASYIYLDKDDLVLRRQIRHKSLHNVYTTCGKSIPNHHFEVQRVSNSGDTQYLFVLCSVTLRFIFCFGVHIILNTLQWR